MRVMAIGVNALTGVYGTRYEYGNTAATICQYSFNYINYTKYSFVMSDGLIWL